MNPSLLAFAQEKGAGLLFAFFLLVFVGVGADASDVSESRITIPKNTELSPTSLEVEGNIEERCKQVAGTGDSEAISLFCKTIAAAWLDRRKSNDLNILHIDFNDGVIPAGAIVRVIAHPSLVPQTEFGGLTIEHGTTDGPIVLDQITSRVALTFKRVTFSAGTINRDSLGLPHVLQASISANSATFNHRVMFSQSTILGSVRISRSKFLRGIYFFDTEARGGDGKAIKITNNIIKRGLSIFGEIENGQKEETIDKAWEAKFTIEDNTIDDVQINYSKFFDLSISNNKLRSLNASSISVSGVMTIEHNRVDHDIALIRNLVSYFGEPVKNSASDWHLTSSGPSISANRVIGNITIEIEELPFSPDSDQDDQSIILREIDLSENNTDGRFSVILPESMVRNLRVKESEKSKTYLLNRERVVTRVNLRDITVKKDLKLSINYLRRKKDESRELNVVKIQTEQYEKLIEKVSIPSQSGFRACRNLMRRDAKKVFDKSTILKSQKEPKAEDYFRKLSMIDLSGSVARTLHWALPYHCYRSVLADEFKFENLNLQYHSVNEEPQHQVKTWVQILALPTPENMKIISDKLYRTGELQIGLDFLERSKQLDHAHAIPLDSWKNFAVLDDRWTHAEQVSNCLFSYPIRTACLWSYARVILLYPGGYGAKPARALLWLVGVWFVGAFIYWSVLHRAGKKFEYLGIKEWRVFEVIYFPYLHLKFPRISDGTFTSFGEEFKPEGCSVWRYSLDAVLPVINLHAYDRYFASKPGVRFIAGVQHILGWWLISVFIASISVL